MKIAVIVFLALLTTTVLSQPSIKGSYVAYQKMNKQLSGDSQEVWYSKNSITFKNNAVFFEQSPVSIKNGDASYSASDGGFYYYKGSLKPKGSKFFAHLKFISCDYCADGLVAFTPPELIIDSIDAGRKPVQNNNKIKQVKAALHKPKVWEVKYISSTKIMVNNIIYIKATFAK